MNRRFLPHVAALLCVALWAASAAGQTTITLRDAIAMALEKNPARKVALADRSAAAAGAREARSILMPRLNFSESATRSNDPVFAFGTRLRQQRFTAADFALNRLNRPAPIADISSRLSAQWTVFDSLQNLRQVERAKLADRAAQQQLDRVEQELVFRVIDAYYAALLANREVQVAEASLNTAQALEERGRIRVTSGVVVEADLLTAQTQTAVRRQNLIRARDGAAFAHSALALMVGAPPDVVLDPAEMLAERPVENLSFAELEARALARRPDLQRIATEETAQHASLVAAKSAYGPRVNVFGSWQTDSPSLGWNGGNNWVAGAEVQLEIFDGGARQARIAREKAMAERVAALRDQAQDAVRLEVRRAYYELDAAQQQVQVAKFAIAQAKESLRINQDRYEGGLSTVTEVLRVEEAAHRAQADYWDAVYRVHLGAARLQLATGTLNPDSIAVNP